MDWTHWWPLREDSTGDILLTVDFRITRATGSFADLVASLPGAGPVYQTLLSQPAPAPATAQPGHFLGGWLADLGRYRRRVRAVLGYCAGAPLASAIADGVEELGLGHPDRILIEPQTVHAGTISGQFAEAVAGLAEAIPTGETEPDLAEVAAAAAQADASLVALAELALARYERLARVCAARLALGDVLADELGSRFAGYLSYLVACSRISPGGPGVTSTVVASPDHVVPFPAHRVVRVTARPATMLGEVTVAQAVAGLLDTSSCPATPALGEPRRNQ